MFNSCPFFISLVSSYRMFYSWFFADFSSGYSFSDLTLGWKISFVKLEVFEIGGKYGYGWR